MKKKEKKKKEFSKVLLIQESALIWVATLGFLVLAYIAVINDYMGALPWLTAMSACPWAAYGVSQACYYFKAMKENGPIKYDTVMKQLEYNLEKGISPEPQEPQYMDYDVGEDNYMI